MVGMVFQDLSFDFLWSLCTRKKRCKMLPNCDKVAATRAAAVNQAEVLLKVFRAKGFRL